MATTTQWIHPIWEWLSSAGGWLTASAIVAVVAWMTGNRWERRKLSRSERANAYASFLDACSRRWRAFADRDGADPGSAALEEAETRVRKSRDEAYQAYTIIQILGSQAAVEAALNLLRAYDQRNKSYKDGGKTPGVGADAKAELLGKFVTVARDDLHLKALDTEKLRRPVANSNDG